MRIRTKKASGRETRAVRHRPKRSPRQVPPGAISGASGGEVTLYHAPGGRIQLEVRVERDTVWLTQAQMATLFGRERFVVSKHLNNVFRERELDRKAMCKICTFPLLTSRLRSTAWTPSTRPSPASRCIQQRRRAPRVSGTDCRSYSVMLASGADAGWVGAE